MIIQPLIFEFTNEWHGFQAVFNAIAHGTPACDGNGAKCAFPDAPRARKNRLTIVNFILYLKRNSGLKNLEKEVVRSSPVLVISRPEKRSLYPHAFNHENQKKWRKS
jgi:hypothetical protein